MMLVGTESVEDIIGFAGTAIVSLPDIEPAEEVLPGEVPGVVTVGPWGAPDALLTGAPLLSMAAGGIVLAADGGVLVPVLPGEAPGAVTVAAFGAPVGAGPGVAVCAQAAPAMNSEAAEASQSERMKYLLV